jgi:hypothetical protein
LTFGPLVNISSEAIADGSSGAYLPVSDENLNLEGVAIMLYWNLQLYERETGNILAYEQILDFLSQEFEDDGEMRIYNNGRHPEIQDFVEWSRFGYAINMKHELQMKLWSLYDAYFAEHETTPRFSDIFIITIEMYNELMKKDDNPDYELDLTSIINRYIEEGRAWVSEDGITLEFTVPEV